MTEFAYQGALPSPEEFRQTLAQAQAAANPVDDLLALSARLHVYEQRYALASDAFYRQYQAGTLNEELQHAVEWVALYDLFIKTKRMLEATLMRVAVQPDWSETQA